MNLNNQKTSEYSDEELLELALENTAYFSLLVKRYKEKFFYYLKRFAGFRNDDIEDVIQDRKSVV